MKWLLAGAVIAAFGLSLTFLVWRSPASSGSPELAGQQRKPGRDSVIEGTGTVEPASEVHRLMFRTGGVIRACRVKAGDEARTGEVLCELDSSIQRADLELAQKQLELARAEAEESISGVHPQRIKAVEHSLERLREKIRHASADHERYEKLIHNGTVSGEDYNLARTRRIQAEIELREQEAELVYLRTFVTPQKRAVLAAKIEQAAASVRLAEERLQETRITAPFDGTVLQVLRREGEAVSPSLHEAVLLFGNLSRLHVRAEIEDRLAQQVRVGQKARVSGPNLFGKSHAGRVVAVSKILGDRMAFTQDNAARNNLHVVEVVIEMELGFSAPVGLQVEVRIEGGTH